jgi:hypothetical protein
VGECQVVLKLSSPALLRREGDKELTIITTPYRVGTHTTTRPTAFLPIIDQLVAIHAKNYVHGDIRAFNMVFGEDVTNGWLIDFDFAGPCGKTTYPPDYVNSLGDGRRLGRENRMITKMHDWFAIFSVIYVIHVLDDEHMESIGDFYHRFYLMHRYISKTLSNDDFPSEKVDELKELLKDYENAKGRLCPSQSFAMALRERFRPN